MNNSTSKKRGVIYARVNASVASAYGSDNSVERQISECKEKMKRDNVEEVHAPIIDVTSTKKAQNNGLMEVLKLAENGRIDYLYTSGLDRISRDSMVLLYFLFKLRGCNVIVVTPFQIYDIKKIEDLIYITVKAYAAENQIKIRRNTSLKSRIQRFKNRIWISGIPPGFEKKEKWITKSPDWEPVINALFNLFLENKNDKAVRENINETFRDFLKQPLTRQQIKKILRNPLYIGKPQLGGAAIEKAFPATVVDDPNLRFVTDELFAKAQEIIAANDAKYSLNGGKPFPTLT